MSHDTQNERLATLNREVFVITARPRITRQTTGPARVEICYQAPGANLVIAMAPGDAEAVAEELVHAAARAREVNQCRATARGREC
ncbi:hypothetical protein [Acidovorax sp. M2(2025)]|uniref:hypothetical protein n=1 Tax=Acidovorax sp. M2(2025) TaxID=3411355 RepID=UPI003BF5AA5F